MAYSDPRTWVTGELVTAALMNAQLRDNLDAVIEGTTGAYVNAVVGPHAIGGSTVDYVRLGLTGAFTSGGASTVAFGTYTSGVLTGHSGDSAAIAGVKLNNSIVTAGNCTTVAQLWVSEPQITVGAGSVTNSATVYIAGSATEATNDYSLFVDDGVSRFDSNVTMAAGAKLMLGSETSGAGGATVPLQINGTSGALSGLQTGRWSGDTGPATISLVKSRGGTVGTAGVVSNSDGLGNLTWFGDDGTDVASQAASIGAYVDGTPGSNDMPGRIVFSTTPDGAAATVARLTLYSTGWLDLLDGHNPDRSTDGVSTIRLRAPYVDLADGAELEAQCNTGVLLSVQYWAGGAYYYGGLFFAAYHGAVVEIADPNSVFEVSDTGSNYAVYKAAVEGVVHVKNKSGSTRRTSLQIIELSGL